ncbi:MAG: OB-fold domain-containing protein [Deltaproteobacteria bacterium]|nr:OB-fold domain-containing protein [Deltaproteobacteria bacterium]
MVGISSYGAYVPPTRLPIAAIGGGSAKEGGPEKAVAWNDEDAVTMAVAAAVNCLRGCERSQVDSLIFASTSHPFREKQAAALVARALDLPREIRSADHAGSLRAGTTALRSAVDAVVAGSARCVLVVASDCRMGAPGSGLERSFGDGAAAFLVSDTAPIATLDASFEVADEIVDLWRSDGDPFVHGWEDRFVVQQGYTPRVVEAVQGLFERTGSGSADFAKVALFAPDARSHAAVVRGLGLAAEQIQEPFFGRLGNAGVAFAPLQLAAALESARPGERILVAGYGDGADASAFTVSDHIAKLGERRGVSWHLARRRAVASYDRYLKARSLAVSEWQAGRDPGLSATIHFRERDDDLSFRGQKCGGCGAVQFPAQRICESCFAKDDFEGLRLSDRIGKVVTYTFDYFFPTPDPPTVVSIVEVEGARVHLQLVECPVEEVAIGQPVEFVFRRIHEAGGRPNYYWKGTPVPDAKQDPGAGSKP